MSDRKYAVVKIDGREKQLEIVDDNHLWFGGRQYISLERTSEIKKSMIEELRLSNDKVIELTKEIEAYRVLLKGALGMDVVREKGE